MVKYMIKAKIEVDGIVEKHDIIGAIFGQTEGLFGEQLDLRLLQDRGRIGRIQVNVRVQGNKTVGEVLIPSNLDRIETALLAAMVESVDRVGPYDAVLTVTEIVDLRLEKINKIVERAAEILRKWGREKVPDLKEVLGEVQELLRAPEPIAYGKDKLPAGPGVDQSDTVIVVEGRADVINLLRYGHTNVIAIGGARRIPETVKELSKKKKVILFVDGDHVGDLITREVLRTIKVDAIARAPQGKEVEELTGKEIEEALSSAVPVKDYLAEQLQKGNKEAQLLMEIQERLAKGLEAEVKKPEELAEVESIVLPIAISEDAKSLYGTLEAIIYDRNWGKVKRLPTRDLVAELEGAEPGNFHAILVDGIITQRLVDKAREKGVKMIVGARLGKVTFKPDEMVILTFNEI
ncbi:MAG: DNA primase DnaG [Desulfurococcaceae archaeon]